MAGHNQFLLAATAGTMPHVKSERLCAIAVTSRNRLPALPNTPTVRETGYEYEVSNWHGLIGPRGMPPAVVETLNQEINKIVRDPEFAQRIAGDGLVPVGGSPEILLKLLREEIANLAKVVQRAGVKIQ